MTKKVQKKEVKTKQQHHHLYNNKKYNYKRQYKYQKQPQQNTTKKQSKLVNYEKNFNKQNLKYKNNKFIFNQLIKQDKESLLKLNCKCKLINFYLIEEFIIYVLLVVKDKKKKYKH